MRASFARRRYNTTKAEFRGNALGYLIREREPGDEPRITGR
jgi:hypothetical protein